jgi:murein DD-endopeptidase MepM/ murein hydrolase activator NlpD
MQMNSLFAKSQQMSGLMHNNLFVKDNTYRMILQMDTVPYSVRTAGTGGSAESGQLARKDDLTYKVNEAINSLTNQIQMQSGSLKQLYEKAMEYSTEMTHLPAIQPIAREDLIMISSDFGVRSDPFFFVARTHCGLDFVASTGKKVFATGDGIVTFTETSRNGYGNEIVIDHKFGFSTRYAHLNSIEVKAGEQVKRGQIIGTVGETGRATGPHLHYEVLYNNQPVNPSFYFDTSLTKEEFAQIINKANEETN